MPRDGSNIYSQPFPDVVDGTTIESTVYNGFTHDVEIDLNTPRPVSSGGTGASGAADARFNLAAEAAAQVVTNYDSHVWLPGSFRSAAGATGAPNAHAFAGTCYIGEAIANPPTNANVVVEARDMESVLKPGPIYTRQKTAGVWSAWGDISTGDDDATNRAAIYAAPFDALAHNGMQVNGSMEVSQENGLGAGIQISTATPSRYITDQWVAVGIGTAVTTWSQSNQPAPLGFTRSTAMQVNTANPSPAAGHVVCLQQSIEGYRSSRLGFGAAGASSITIGFWVLSAARAGLCSGSVRNIADNRSYVFTFTINATNVWEYKTVTVPGDVTGSWANDSSAGLKLTFSLMCGATFQTAPGVWTAGNFLAAPGTTNFVTSGSDIFLVTGVVVLPGVEAPSAGRSALIMRPYGEELATCKRYWQKFGGNAVADVFIRGYATAGGYINQTLTYPVEMRLTPTGNFAGSWTLSNLSSLMLNGIGSKSLSVQISPTVTGHVHAYTTDSSCFIWLDARL